MDRPYFWRSHPACGGDGPWTNLKHENVVDDFGRRHVEREHERLVPDGRVGWLADVGLFDLSTQRHSTDRADVVALQLSAFDDADSQLHASWTY